MDEATAWNLLAQARVMRLATHGPGGRIDLVPITFALTDDGQVVCAVDHKPKRTVRLARLANIERDPRVTVLADHYDDIDWSTLWWVRVHGTARVVEPGSPDHHRAVEQLRSRYAHYATQPPSGPAVLIEPGRILGWRASPPAP